MKVGIWLTDHVEATSVAEESHVFSSDLHEVVGVNTVGSVQEADKNGVRMQFLDHVKKTHHNVVSTSCLATRQHTADLNYTIKKVQGVLTLRGFSLLRTSPFSLSTLSSSWGIPSGPSLRSVGKSWARPSLMGRGDFLNEIFVDDTSAMDEGVEGTKLSLNFWRVEKFLKGAQMLCGYTYLSVLVMMMLDFLF